MKRITSNTIACAMLCSIVILSSCAQLRRTSDQQDSAMRDTVYMQVTAGEFKEVSKVEAATAVTLRGVGASSTFRLGQPVAIAFEGVDVDSHTIVTMIDEASGTVTMRVLSRRDGVVTISEKCQILRCSSLYDLPKIAIGPGLEIEQIIVTPLCNDKGVYAYEVRYGSQERGCRRSAETGQRLFRKCSDTPQPASRQVKRGQAPKRRPVKEYFGL